MFSKETYMGRRAKLKQTIGSGLLLFLGNDESGMNYADNTYHFPAEMADVDCILFVRGKKATPEMLQLASENNMILLETCHSMYHVAGELYCSGLVPVY